MFNIIAITVNNNEVSKMLVCHDFKAVYTHQIREIVELYDRYM